MSAVDWFSPELTQSVSVPGGRVVFRRGGFAEGTPLLLCHRFRGTIDDWDPAFLNVLAAERDVIVFDGAGVGYSSGEVPSTVAGMAGGVIDLFGALELDEVDVLGWSMGGFVAQSVALSRPEMVRRLIVAGSKPGLVPGAPAPDPEVGRVAGKPVNDADDLLYLCFSRLVRRAASPGWRLSSGWPALRIQPRCRRVACRLSLRRSQAGQQGQRRPGIVSRS